MDDQAKAIEKANSYRSMMDTWAFKDFKSFLDEERKTALQLAIHSDDIKDIQLQRGIVKCLDAIESHLGYVLSTNGQSK